MPTSRPASPSEGEIPVHDRLLAAGLELFAADGYDGASTAAIARRAGTSESQLVKHFGSKEGLLEAIFDQGWHALDQTVRKALGGAGSPVQRLAILGQTMMTALGEDRRLRNLMLLEGRRVRKRGHEIVLSGGFRQFLGQLDGVLQDISAAGQLRSKLPLDAVRSAVMGAFEGLLRDQLMAELITYPARYDRKAMLAAFEVVLAAFLTPAGVRALRPSAGSAARTATRRPEPGRRPATSRR
jgi:AcrR family transcriptional regulator